MALRARLVAPPIEPPSTWPWHTAKCASLQASVLIGGDRRLEAETYLSSGFGIRVTLEAKKHGWTRFDSLARVWMPGRLKGILVSPDHGTPFLTATQAYDVRPIPRKWLALSKTSDAANRFVSQGTILVTCSGAVGRPTIAYAPHDQKLISHDLLRVDVIDQRQRGWVYAYLHSPQARAMMSGSHYGHIIKHLETSHLDSLPIPTVSDSVAQHFATLFQDILDHRNEGYRLTVEAESRFQNAIGDLKVTNWGERGFSVRAVKSLLLRRRRLDASAHNPAVTTIRKHLAKNGIGFTTVRDAGYDVWVPGRYKRIPAESGVIYRDSADLLEVSPDLTKRFADCGFGDVHRGRVKDGWILVPSSGQVYGIIGTAVLSTSALDNQVVSNHVIRLAPRTGAVRTGYVVTALSHLTLGRPVVKSLAFGSSVPEIAPDDLADFEIVRLPAKEEDAIADLAEDSAKARSKADELELDLARQAGALIGKFMVG